MAYYTEEGYNKLKNELKYLKTKGRKEIADAIAEARDKGDLSENYEYKAAKDAQSLFELKIAKLAIVVGDAKILDESHVADASVASILSKVKIKNVANGMEVMYLLVSEDESDLASGKISTSSPIGKGLLGTRVGDIAKVQAPAGEIEFEILEIGR